MDAWEGRGGDAATGREDAAESQMDGRSVRMRSDGDGDGVAEMRGRDDGSRGVRMRRGLTPAGEEFLFAERCADAPIWAWAVPSPCSDGNDDDDDAHQLAWTWAWAECAAVALAAVQALLVFLLASATLDGGSLSSSSLSSASSSTSPPSSSLSSSLSSSPPSSSLSAARIVALALFVLWRTAATAGLGAALASQASGGALVAALSHCGLAPRPLPLPLNPTETASGTSASQPVLVDNVPQPARTHAPRSQYAAWAVAQASARFERSSACILDYDATPADFVAWLFFLQIADIVLANDVTAFVILVATHWNAPDLSAFTPLDTAFLIGGTLLVVFNVAFKLSARLAMSDYDWYWGSFFFLDADIEPETVADISASPDGGVPVDLGFTLLPHPLYSVGFVGYYGAALMSQSYTVLYAALAAHAAQIMFLYLVERPHTAKLREAREASAVFSLYQSHASHLRATATDAAATTLSAAASARMHALQEFFARDLVIVRGLDLFRSTDILTLVIYAQTILSAILVGPIDGASWRLWFYIGQTVFWRVIHTYGLGLVLLLQDRYKLWTRHFVRHGESLRDAFQHWKVLFNLSLTMTYVSFTICAWRLYRQPESYAQGPAALKDILGVLFIILHVWITLSTFEVRGAAGWFFSDFFIGPTPWSASGSGVNGAARQGIYRYLENPLMYTFSCWGLTLISGSWAMFGLTVFAQVSNWLLHTFVAEPHERRLYGEPTPLHAQRRHSGQSDGSYRKKSGSKRNIRKSIRHRMRSLRKHVRRVSHDVVVTMERFEIVDTIMSRVRSIGSLVGSVRPVATDQNLRRRYPHVFKNNSDGDHDDGVDCTDHDPSLFWKSGDLDARSDVTMHSVDDTIAHASGEHPDSCNHRQCGSSNSGDAANASARSYDTISDSVQSTSDSSSDSEYDYDGTFLRSKSDHASDGNANGTENVDGYHLANNECDDRPDHASASSNVPASPVSGVLARARTVSQTVHQVVRELEELVDTAKPRVKAMVDETRLRVTNLANAACLEDALPREELPLHLYSISVISPTLSSSNDEQCHTTDHVNSRSTHTEFDHVDHADDQNPAVVIQFGEPIIIEFTAVRETMKRKDWIGLYSIGQNFRPDITTSKCDTRWSYVAGHHKQLVPIRASVDGSSRNGIAVRRNSTSGTGGYALLDQHFQSSAFPATDVTFYDEKTSPWITTRDSRMRFGRTEVSISPSPGDPGLRVVRGRLVFSREQLPWQIGVFEARYHYDGKYVVLARSPKFRVSMDLDPLRGSRAKLSAWPDAASMSLHHSSDQEKYVSKTRNAASLPPTPHLSPPASPTHHLSIQSISSELQPIVERCLDLHSSHGDEGLDFHESMLDRVTLPPVLLRAVPLHRYRRDVCRRIAYVIKHLYGIDFTWKVVELARSLNDLAARIHDALDALQRC